MNSNIQSYASHKQLTELHANVIRNLPSGLPMWWVQRLIEKPALLQRKLKGALAPPAIPKEKLLLEMLSDWEKFYRTFFKIKLDLSEVLIPKEQKEFDQILFIAGGLTLPCVLEACKKSGRSVMWNVSAVEGVMDERMGFNETYALRICGLTNGDEKFLGMTVGDIRTKNIKTMTIMEYLIFGLKFQPFMDLDQGGATLCSGSRLKDGKIPVVNFLKDSVTIDWLPEEKVQNSVRSREVLTM